MYDDPRSANVVNAKNAFDPVDRFIWAAQPSGVRFNGGPVFKTDGYMTDYLTDQAIEAIEANRNRPFFMYLAYNAPIHRCRPRRPITTPCRRSSSIRFACMPR